MTAPIAEPKRLGLFTRSGLVVACALALGSLVGIAFAAYAMRVDATHIQEATRNQLSIADRQQDPIPAERIDDALQERGVFAAAADELARRQNIRLIAAAAVSLFLALFAGLLFSYRAKPLGAMDHPPPTPSTEAAKGHPPTPDT